MITIEALLAEHPFFQGLSPEHIHLLAGCARNVRFNENQFVFREGEEADEFYIIRHGKVALEVYAPPKGTITIQTLEEGEVLGWAWLFPPYNWHFDARAIELTRAIALDGACLRRKCEEDPKLGYELTRRVAMIVIDRLQNTRLQLLDIYGNGEPRKK